MACKCKTIAGAEQVVVAGHIGQEGRNADAGPGARPKSKKQVREQVAQQRTGGGQAAPLRAGCRLRPLPRWLPPAAGAAVAAGALRPC